MGLVRKSVPTRWFLLEQLRESGDILRIDIDYAKLQAPNGTEEEAALYCGLLAMARKGHLCLDVDAMDDLPPLLQTLIRKEAKEKKRFYLPKNSTLEDSIVENIFRLLSYPPRPKTGGVEKVTEQQRKAVENALLYPLSLITGGPGTGKTYTAAQIVHAFVACKKTSILLAAPTGKAASHLASKIGIEDPAIQAGTLHSFLKRDHWQHKIHPLHADLVIVDEASMIDPLLFSHLLAAIGPETTLVLMGDSHQLPAVAGGSLFADLVSAQTAKIPTTVLDISYRSDRKEILELAQSILEGKPQDIRNISLGFDTGNLELIYQKLWLHAQKHFPKEWLKETNQFRILSTLRKGPLGTDALNAFLYEKFSSLTDQFPIMITRNDPRTGLCNGETGVLIKKQEAHFSGGRVFPFHQLPSFTYAYCISVHKSQGSEYEHVLFLVPPGSEAFGREVLYTAVTRAKNRLEIDGDPAPIALALARTSRKISGIPDKLKGR